MGEETGKRIGDYQILNELGSGGMGRVYRVRNVISDRIEAMKILLPDLAGRQELAARFLREIKLLASLNHPNIAALRTALTVDNQLVMIMEYVEGATLADHVQHGPIPALDAVNYIDQVLSALSYAHQQHVIHRDIKPANMILTPQGVIKLMDFGIARAGDERSLTMTGTTLGSLSYMSPEQVKGEATDARSDLYSVGVSLYELVTGQRPFQAHSDYSIMAAHVKEMPKPPIELEQGLSPALNEIILMAIAKEPAQRFQTADAFRNALSSVPTAASASQAAAPSTGPVTPDAAVTATVLPVVPAPAPTPRVAAPAPTPSDAKVARVPSPPPVPTPPPPQAGGHRGLYMTLGALIVLAVLVAAGIYVPRRSKTQATTTPSQPQSNAAQSMSTGSQDGAQQAPPAVPTPSLAESNSSPQQTAPLAMSPGVSNAAQTSSIPSQPPDAHPRKLASKSSGTGPAVPATTREADNSVPSDNAAAAAPNNAADGPADLDELEHEVDQLSSRAAAVDASLDRLQQEQNIAGYGLRGDIVNRRASMRTNLSKADSAVRRGDVEPAKRYMNLAQGDVEALEHFLGH
jgi:eukaryotic-like serine/threonine-protein kinase